MIDLCIIIVSFNTKDLTKACLDSVLNGKFKKNLEIRVVDNASTDGSIEMLESYEGISLIKSSENLGFARANNLAFRQANSKYYLMLNSDTIVDKGVLDILYEETVKHDYGISSCQLKYANGNFQPNGGDLPKLFPVLSWLTGVDDICRMVGIKVATFHYNQQSEFGGQIGWVAGTAMVIRRDVIDTVGLLDEKLFMYVEDVDYCWRASRMGHQIGWVRGATIMHIGGGSSKSPRVAQWRGEFRGLVYLYRKYYGSVVSILLRLLIVLFGVVRMVGFGLLGKWDYSKAYGKVIINF